jgi:glycosyltransferase involved in cell wall biosynthesis
MRILVVNWQDRQNPQSGGAETHLHEIFGRLAAQGDDVTLLVSGWRGAPARVELDGMEVHRTGGRYTFSAAAPWYYRRHLRGGGFDVVVEDLNKVPVFTPFWTRAPQVLLVHHLFGTTAFQEASLPVATATWLLERPVPRVFRDVPTVAVSDSTADDLVERGMKRDCITVIPNGIHIDRYPVAGPADAFERPTLLFLGRLKRYKGIDLIFRACAKLTQEGLGVRLLVAGRGDDETRLTSLRDRLGLEDVVEFLGFVSEEEKLQLLRRSWIHVLTSPKEGWGITNVEAAACGTPTVASDSPGLRDSVRHGDTGLLVPHGDVDALASALGRLLQDDELRATMGRSARGFAESLSWDASAQRFRTVLERRMADRAVNV